MRVAVVRLSSLGDVVHTMGALKPFLAHHEVTWVVDASFAPLLEDEGVHLIPIPLRALKKEKSLKPFLAAVKRLKALERFDAVIDAQGLLKSALLAKLIKGEKWGFDKNSAREKIAARFYDRTVHIDYEEHILKRNLLLFNTALKGDIKHIDVPFLNTQTKNPKTEGAVLLAIGSSKEEKKYPKELFCELANKIEKEVYLIWHGEAEKRDAAYITEHSKAKMLEPMTLPELKATVQNADALIGVDSGVSYMSWALGIKTVILFGPTNVERFCPHNDNVTALSAHPIKAIKPDSILKVLEAL